MDGNHSIKIQFQNVSSILSVRQEYTSQHLLASLPKYSTPFVYISPPLQSIRSKSNLHLAALLASVWILHPAIIKLLVSQSDMDGSPL
jgi:hypothetical protein